MDTGIFGVIHENWRGHIAVDHKGVMFEDEDLKLHALEVCGG